jgi:hypothetical protein
MTDYQKVGLSIYQDFISDDEHIDLINVICSELQRVSGKRYLNRNQVIRYGDTSICHNNYQNIDMPCQIDKISQRLVTNGLLKEKPNAININEYIKGDHIVPHVDRVASGPIVTILSLGSVATMLFENKKTKDKFEIILYPKIVIQMRDIIRWDWNHSIYPVLDTRYSIVFRSKNQ